MLGPPALPAEIAVMVAVGVVAVVGALAVA